MSVAAPPVQQSRIQPRFPDAWCNRGLLRKKQKDWRGAVDDFSRCLEVATSNWPYRGQVARKLQAADGDTDGDGDVDVSDLAALLAAYGTCEGDPAYNAAADVDFDDCVDLEDLSALLANYGPGT